MQAEAGLTVVLFQQLMLEVDLLPVLEHVRLALGQTRAHGEAGFRHVQCLFVLHNASPFIVIFRLSAKQKTPLSPEETKAQQPLRYHSRCRLYSSRPLGPTNRGRGKVTALRRPCLLSFQPEAPG